MSLQPINLRAVTERVLDSIEGLFNQKEIEVELNLENVEIEGDDNWLSQVITNLLTNAIKFSPKRSKITVTLTRIDDTARLSISDRGEGIATFDQSKVFDRYQQAAGTSHRAVGGYGLGLFVCKSVIEEHGGTIGLQSEEGVGSTFFFELRALTD